MKSKLAKTLVLLGSFLCVTVAKATIVDVGSGKSYVVKKWGNGNDILAVPINFKVCLITSKMSKDVNIFFAPTYENRSFIPLSATIKANSEGSITKDEIDQSNPRKEKPLYYTIAGTNDDIENGKVIMTCN